jgi:flagellar basal-body rod protein FlgC
MSVASAIAASGMNAATLRLRVSASNVANAMSAGPLPGTANAASYQSAYVPLRVDQTEAAGGGTSATVSARQPSYVPGYDPGAPYANSHGFVARPNVELTDELYQQLLARFAFAANAQVVRSDTQLMASLLNIKA